LKKRHKKWWPLFVKYGSIWKQIVKKKYGKKWEKRVRIIKRYINNPPPPGTKVTIYVVVFSYVIVKKYGKKWKSKLKGLHGKYWPLYLKYGKRWQLLVKKKIWSNLEK